MVRKELFQHLTSFRFLASSAVFVILAPLASLAGILDYEWRLETHAEKEEGFRDDLLETTVYSFLQPVALQPPEPLSVLDRGFDGDLGNEVTINLFAIPSPALGQPGTVEPGGVYWAGEGSGNPFLTSLRGVDLTMIVQVVLGLQALLLTFDGIVGEREQKNLQLLLAHGVSRSRVLSGKFLGAFLALTIPLAISVLSSVALMIGHGDIDPAPEQWLRLGGLFCTYAVYAAIMLLLGLLLSLAAPSSPRALAYAILAWLGLVFLLPQTAVHGAGALVGSGSDPFALQSEIAELDQELRDHLLEIWGENPVRDRRGGHYATTTSTSWNRAILRRFGSARYYDSLVDYYRKERSLGMRHAERVLDLLREQERRERTVVSLARVLTALSPAAALEELAESLTGTSMAIHDAFLAACRAYREKFIEYLQREGAFESWRWFTDDPPETHPWPSLFGLEPDDVDETNMAESFNRLLEPEIATKMEQMTAEADASRRLDLEDLPAFRFHASDVSLVAPGFAYEWILFLGIGTALAAVAARSFAFYEVE
jgi:ABC-type transport system involved in multi-copper enzyme maturation permease subunit